MTQIIGPFALLLFWIQAALGGYSCHSLIPSPELYQPHTKEEIKIVNDWTACSKVHVYTMLDTGMIKYHGQLKKNHDLKFDACVGEIIFYKPSVREEACKDFSEIGVIIEKKSGLHLKLSDVEMKCRGDE